MQFLDIPGWRTRCAVVASALLLSGTPAFAALFGVGADAQGVGRVFTPLEAPATSVALGDGSAAFNGGLTFSLADNRFYSIANDSFGASVLTSFSQADPATLSAPIRLGSGFVGGLASQGDRLYAVAQDFNGAASLYRVDGAAPTLLGALGGGLYGGLTYNPRDGLLYAIAADDTGVQRRLLAIDASASGGPTTTTVFDLGDGTRAFQGGLAWDDADRRFVAIANDSSGASQLVAFTRSDAASLVDLATPLSPGYVNAGLAWTPAVPEPHAGWLLLAGLAALATRRAWARRAVPKFSS